MESLLSITEKMSSERGLQAGLDPCGKEVDNTLIGISLTSFRPEESANGRQGHDENTISPPIKSFSFNYESLRAVKHVQASNSRARFEAARADRIRGDGILSEGSDTTTEGEQLLRQRWKNYCLRWC